MTKSAGYLLVVFVASTIGASSRTNLQQRSLNLSVRWVQPGVALVSWNEAAPPHSPYRVYLDGTRLGGDCFPVGIGSFGNVIKCSEIQLNIADPDKTSVVEVKVIGPDGKTELAGGKLSFNMRSIQPEQVFLTALEPHYRLSTNSRLIGRASEDRPLSIGGKKYETGIYTPANAENDYDIQGLFSTFTCTAGLQDRGGVQNRISVQFVILGDGKELWHTSPLRNSDGARTAEVSLKGIHRLTLQTISSDGDQVRFNRGQADWASGVLAK